MGDDREMGIHKNAVIYISHGWNIFNQPKEIKMFSNGLPYRLIVVVLLMIILLTACAPQPALEPTTTQALPVTTLSSPTASPNSFAGNKAWIAYQTNRT